MTKKERGPPRSSTYVLVVLFGVIAPILALVVEASDGMCADAFFDPVPTVIHAALVLLTPTAALCGLAARTRPELWDSRWAVWAWGGAVGVAAWYSIIFAPLAPLSVIAIVAFGLGFLSLAPLTVFVSLIAVRPGPGVRRGWVWGAAGALLLLSAVDVPTAVGHVLLSRATSPDPETSARAIERLRDWVPDDAIVASASDPPSPASPLAGLARLAWDGDFEARAVAAWRATGRVPTRIRRGFWMVGDDGPVATQLDEQGGTVVGTRIADLCLGTSAMVGDVDVGAAVADVRWQMTFRNQHEWLDAEARALVRLPPGGVVSDATLWVDGTPRPAVIAPTADARRAYENVVVRERRDPLLITYAGPGDVLVQCFPVPSRGTMRIELRMALPVEPGDGTTGRLELPRLVERNFAFCAGASHTATLEGQVHDLHIEEGLDGGSSLEVPCRPRSEPVWVPDRSDPTSVIVRATETVTPQPPPGLVLVIDASTSTRGARDQVTAALDALQPQLPVAVVVASDQPVDATGGLVPWSEEARALVDGALDDVPWRGGVDACAALDIALDLGREKAGTAVLWLHGRQEMLLASAAPGAPRDDWGEIDVEAGWRSLGGGVHAVRIGDGDNVLLRYARRDGDVVEPRVGSAAELISSWLAPEPRDEPRLRRMPVTERPVDAVPGTADHALAALWAAGEVEALLAHDRDWAVEVAEQYRIVSPVTAAVVLETDQDYVDAGLTDASSPVPEPGVWAILGVVALMLLIAWRRRRSAAVA